MELVADLSLSNSMGFLLHALLGNSFSLSYSLVLKLYLFKKFFAWIYLSTANGMPRRKCGLVGGASRAGSKLESICLHRFNLQC